VFGPEWETAGRYTQLLAPWLLVNFVTSPVSTLPFVLNKQKPWLVVGLIYNILIPMTFLVTAQASGHNIEQTLGFVSVVGSLYLVGVIIWLSKLSIRT
jgi:O-antigen/teichoic acid export membrane protein